MYIKKYAGLMLVVAVAVSIQCVQVARAAIDYSNQAPDLEPKTSVSSFAQVDNGIGNVRAAEVMGYTAESEYRNVIDGSIPFSRLQRFQTLTLRAYLPQTIKAYGVDMLWVLIHAESDNGAYNQYVVRAVQLTNTDKTDNYLARREFGVPMHIVGDHKKYKYLGGRPFRSAKSVIDPEKPRYLELTSDDDVLWKEFTTLLPRDLERQQYQHEFQSIKIKVSLYGAKFNGHRNEVESYKTEFNTDANGKVTQKQVPASYVAVNFYTPGRLMAAGEFDIRF